MRAAAHALEARRREGRFYTPAPLADLLAALAVRAPGVRVLDPAAGEGALLAAAARRGAVDLCGVERDERAAQMAGALGARIWHADFAGLEDGALGTFDAVLANPPYVRQERLDDRARARGGRADLYVYFALRALALLRPGGRLAMVTSNAWLDAAYGASLREKVRAAGGAALILESAVERWFPEAAVRAAVLAARPGLPADAPVRFALLKRPLAELDPDRLVARCERARESFEDEEVRVRVVPREALRDRLWGAWLRAPEIFFDVVRRAGSKLAPLSEMADLRYGVKSGANAFFYFSAREAARTGIEPRFLRPLFKSARDLKSLAPRPEELVHRAFVCDGPLEALPPGARAWIARGAVARTVERGGHKKGGMPLPLAPSLCGRRPWWRLDPGPAADFVAPQFFDARFGFPRVPHGAVCDHTVWLGTVRPGVDRGRILAALNCSWTFLAAEVLGRQNLGEGLLTLYGPELRALPVPRLPRQGAREVLDAFRALAARPPLHAREEAERADRRRLDHAVFALMGLGAREADEVVVAWADLVERRRAFARQGRQTANEQNSS